MRSPFRAGDLAAFAVVLLVAGLLAGCWEEPGEDMRFPPPIVEDSAGVTVVTHARGLFDTSPRPPASFAPDLDRGAALRIGVVTGDEAYQFTNPVGGARLIGGGIAVLDQQSATLRFFDADGVHLRTVGSRGEGPGEFQGPNQLLHLPGDTLLVFDPPLARFHWYGPDGRFLGEVSAGSLGLEGRPTRVVPAADGGLLVLESRLPNGNEEQMESGRVREELTLFHVRVGEPPVRVGTFPGEERAVQIQRAGGEVVSIQVRGGWVYARGITAPGPDGLWSTDGLRREVLLRGAPGGPDAGRALLHTRIRFEDPVRPLTPAVRDSLERTQLEDAPDPQTRERIRESQQATEYPSELPPILDLLGDRQGRLWIAPLEIPVRTLPTGLGREAPRWLVLERDGTVAGWVTLPPRSRPLQVSEEGVLLVRVDDLEVPYVEWWPAPRFDVRRDGG